MMMNELLRDLINIGKVAAFIDNVIVGMEDEEEHNELVAEVVKRLEENNLYIKPEKCKWKMREVGLLGVVIGPEGIKMEEEKVKGVLDWCHMQVHLSRNYIPAVISSSNYTSLSSIVAIFLITYLMAVLQPSGYSVFHGGDTPI